MLDPRTLAAQRVLFALGAVACAGLMATALYMQHVMELEPCPLCVFQRVFVMVAGALMLLAALHNSAGFARRLYGGLIALVAVLGIVVAGRHVWLQSLPADQVPECGPGLEYILSAFPLSEAMALVFKGSGECAEVQWSFLGLSIPGWTLLIFIALALFGLFIALTRPRPAASRA